MMSSQLRPPEFSNLKNYRFLYFSELLRKPVCTGKIKDRIGKLTDIVFKLSEPYPEAVGIYLEFGWGKPTQFIPWDKVARIEDDAIFVAPPPDGAEQYPPFVDQPGWIMANEHLVGRTILDMDGRRIEVVNDVHMMESKGRIIIVHVDISFNGFLSKWGLGRLHWIKDQFISWKYVQPLSLEDASAKAKDAMNLSVTRRQLAELPSEDLADALEELSGEEQQAVFQALDSEKAAETLVEAEPRAQRQIIANLRLERARTILSEMSVPQLAGLFSVLPHDDKQELMALLPADEASRVQAILADREADARDMMTSEYMSMPREAKVGDVLRTIRTSGHEHDVISYIYIVNEEKTLLGVVDLRELVLAGDNQTMGDIMVSPVVSTDDDDVREDIAELFAKYHYRMLPVVDKQDRLLGVVHFNDIMKGYVTRAKI
ncbi:MAG TPA: CBS domain-containing protein [Tepidisphaeraceae bacterium]|nr:CBS domain-containing protein [Tepidisphaeraceae bacterium]